MQTQSGEEKSLLSQCEPKTSSPKSRMRYSPKALRSVFLLKIDPNLPSQLWLEIHHSLEGSCDLLQVYIILQFRSTFKPDGANAFESLWTLFPIQFLQASWTAVRTWDEVLNGIPSGQYMERDSSPSRLKLGEDVISETSGAKCDWAVSKSVCV